MFSRWARAALLASLLLVTCALAARAQGDAGHVDVITVHGVIDAINAQYVGRGIDTAVDDGAVCLIIELDTPGGLDSSMRTIVRRMLTVADPRDRLRDAHRGAGRVGRGVHHAGGSRGGHGAGHEHRRGPSGQRRGRPAAGPLGQGHQRRRGLHPEHRRAPRAQCRLGRAGRPRERFHHGQGGPGAEGHRPGGRRSALCPGPDRRAQGGGGRRHGDDCAPAAPRCGGWT